MKPSCQVTQVALSVWSPHRSELPDEIATHIESCPACQSAFDDLFPRWHPLTEAKAPPTHRTRRSRQLLLLAALSAAGLLLAPSPLQLSPAAAVVWEPPGESILTTDDLFSTPECPLTTDLEHPVCELG